MAKFLQPQSRAEEVKIEAVHNVSPHYFLSTYGSNNVCLTYSDSKPSESAEEVTRIIVSIFYGYPISKILRTIFIIFCLFQHLFLLGYRKLFLMSLTQHYRRDHFLLNVNEHYKLKPSSPSSSPFRHNTASFKFIKFYSVLDECLWPCLKWHVWLSEIIFLTWQADFKRGQNLGCIKTVLCSSIPYFF